MLPYTTNLLHINTPDFNPLPGKKTDFYPLSEEKKIDFYISFHSRRLASCLQPCIPKGNRSFVIKVSRFEVEQLLIYYKVVPSNGD
jgi:hypothetical protein